jgi:hypothetical protein
MLSTPHVTEFIGIYDADGGIAGELRYALGVIFQGRHCSLCDITHGRLNRKREWDEACQALPAPFTLLHLNERSPEIAAACTQGVPTILIRLSDECIQPLLGPDDLEVDGNVDQCVRRIKKALNSRDLM